MRATFVRLLVGLALALPSVAVLVTPASADVRNVPADVATMAKKVKCPEKSLGVKKQGRVYTCQAKTRSYAMIDPDLADRLYYAYLDDLGATTQCPARRQIWVAYWREWAVMTRSETAVTTRALAVETRKKLHGGSVFYYCGR